MENTHLALTGVKKKLDKNLEKEYNKDCIINNGDLNENNTVPRPQK